MNILYQSDDNYAIYMGVSICSLLENNKSAKNICIYIIDDAITEVHKSEIKEMVASYNREVVFIPAELILEKPNSKLFAEYTGMRKNKHSYLKLFLAGVLPESLDRILYIDCDTLVTGSVEDVFNIDMKENCIAMSYDSLIYQAKKTIGFELTDEYYNSGVILVDLNNWKKHNCENRIVEHVKEHGQYGTVDQDVLNVELKEEIYTLPMAYNVQPIHLVYSIKTYFRNYKMKDCYYTKQEIEEAVNKPIVLHFLRYIGESPWHKDNVHPASDAFDSYLKLTPWKDYEKQPSNRGFIFKVEKLLYKVLPKEIFIFIFTLYHENMIAKSNKGSK